jgi:hypothetical protein
MEQEQKQSAEVEVTSVAQPATQPTQEKHNTASRLLTATVFGALVAGKVNSIGQVADVKNILGKANEISKDELKNMKYTKKFRIIWDAVVNNFKTEMNNYSNPVKGFIVAGSKAFKYTIITSVIGGAVGGAIGWKLGERIENWRDLYKHPWQSTKIMLGLEKPEVLLANTAPTHNKKPEQEKSTKWQDYAKERQADSAAIGKAV